MIAGEQLDQRKLDLTLILINLVNIAVDISVVVLYIVKMVELWQLTNTDASLSDINTNLQLFTGYVMLASAITILVSYKCMRDSFIKSTNLRGSQYKDSL